MDELNKARALFLTDDLDEETREDNAQMIKDWETQLIQHEAFAGWREHDITTQIVLKLKEQYKEFSLTLALKRTLTDADRVSLWAKQDACAFLLSVVDKDAKSVVEQIHREIRAAINVT